MFPSPAAGGLNFGDADLPRVHPRGEDAFGASASASLTDGSALWAR